MTRTLDEYRAARRADLMTPAPTLAEYRVWVQDDPLVARYLQPGDLVALLHDALQITPTPPG